MDLTMIDPVWWIVLGVLVVVVIGLLVWSRRRRTQRTERLKSQFKSEYERTASSSSKKKAEEDLERRSVRRSRMDLAELDESDAESLEQHLDELLRSFVDGPQGAALGMEHLVGRIATARGYVATEGSVLDLVSVDHPEQVAALRRSEAEMEKAKGADLTEASRQTFLSARVLAERLLAEGRAGHLDDDVPEPPVDDDVPEPPPPAARRSSSDRSVDAPTPPPAPEGGSPAPESDGGLHPGSTSEPVATDDSRGADSADASPGR